MSGRRIASQSEIDIGAICDSPRALGAAPRSRGREPHNTKQPTAATDDITVDRKGAGSRTVSRVPGSPATSRRRGSLGHRR